MKRKKLIEALRSVRKYNLSKSAKRLLLMSVLVHHFEDEEIEDLASDIWFAKEKK